MHGTKCQIELNERMNPAIPQFVRTEFANTENDYKLSYQEWNVRNAFGSTCV